MKPSTIKYFFRESFSGLKKNMLMTMASIIAVAACIYDFKHTLRGVHGVGVPTDNSGHKFQGPLQLTYVAGKGNQQAKLHILVSSGNNQCGTNCPHQKA